MTLSTDCLTPDGVSHMKGNPKFDKVVNEAILEVVEKQIRSGKPPETRQTYERLVKSGYSDEEPGI